MDIVQDLISNLRAYDESRERSLQVELGASSLGGCRRQAWHIIKGTPRTNHNTDFLAALFGTAMHAIIADSFTRADIFGDRYLVEKEFRSPEILCHADLVTQGEKHLTDWKTNTLKAMAKFPTTQQKWQANVNAYCAKNEGIEIETVSLVAIPRDGSIWDIEKWEEPFNQNYVDEALAWKEDVESREEPPAPERPAYVYCRKFCKFYDKTGEIGCQGR